MMELNKYANRSKYKTLKCLEEGKPKTQTAIAEELGTSQVSACRKINHLLDEECVTEEGVFEGYSITDKGLKLMNLLEEIQNL